MIGGDLVSFWLMWGVPTNMAVIEKPVAPTFSRSIRLLDSFKQNFFRKADTSEVV